MQEKMAGRLVFADGTALDGGGAGAPGRRRRTGLSDRHGRLPGGADRPLVCRADAHLHLPAVGNYGAGPAACESDQIHAPRALIVHQLHERRATAPATTICTTSCAAQGVPALTGVDTRALVRAHLARTGVMPAALAVGQVGASCPPSAELAGPGRRRRLQRHRLMSPALHLPVPTWHPPARPRRAHASR